MLPLHCALCGAAACDTAARGVTARALCAGCREDLALLRLTDPCAVCALPHNAPLCGACAAAPPPLARLLAGRQYAPPLDGLVAQYKYGGQWQLASELAALMPPPPQADLAVPVPLHPLRERWRGFNQARELAKKIGLRPAAGVLARIVNTPKQADTASAIERRRNIRGAFAASAAARGKSVLLIDDVATSGATLHEAARALLRAGATEVLGLVVARKT